MANDKPNDKPKFLKDASSRRYIRLREKRNGAAIQEWSKLIKQGDRLLAISVFFDCKDLLVADGDHRIEAHTRANKRERLLLFYDPMRANRSSRELGQHVGLSDKTVEKHRGGTICETAAGEIAEKTPDAGPGEQVETAQKDEGATAENPSSGAEIPHPAESGGDSGPK